MGQLTTALKATKILRKQFHPAPKSKKPTKHEQRIIDSIVISDFGCQKENTFLFAEAILNKKLARPEEWRNKNQTYFECVPGSLLCRTAKDRPNEDGVFVIDRNNIRHKNQICFFGVNGAEYRSYREKRNWRPATDKEIKEYFS